MKNVINYTIQTSLIREKQSLEENLAIVYKCISLKMMTSLFAKTAGRISLK